MEDHHSARSPFDRAPFVVRTLLAGALALSMICISAAVALMLLTVAVGATPGRHTRATLVADDAGCPLPHGLLLRSFVRRTFE